MKALIPSAFALLLAGGAAQAQETPTPPPPQQQQQQQQPAPPPAPSQQQQQQTQVSDSDVQKFAEIYLEVEEARNALSVELNDAASQEEAQEIQARMQEEIVATIADHGWSVSRYNEVATVISNDEELRSQALDLIDELSSS